MTKKSEKSKYDPLRNWLKRQTVKRLSLPFEDIEDEDKLGVKLPMSARIHPEWWADEAFATLT